MRARPSVILILPLLVVAFQCASNGKPEGFDFALDTALENLETGEGKDYDAAFCEVISPRYRRAFDTCLKRHYYPLKLGDANLLFRIDSSGNAVESLYWPRTAMLFCIHNQIYPFSLPPPPRPNYWVVLQLMHDK